VRNVSEVRTVLGPLDPTKLGITSFQEFFILSLPGWNLSPEAPEIFNRAATYDRLEKELLAFKRLGGQSIVDGTGITGGRDVYFLAQLSRRSGVNIVATTGFLDESFVPGHFFPDRGRDEDYLSRLFFEELNIGAVSGGMIRTDIKPGLICIRGSSGRFTQMEMMALRGAARASSRSGAAVLTDGGGQPAERLDVLLKEGAKPERIVLSIGTDNWTTEQIESITAMGVCVSYDRIAWTSIGTAIRSVSEAVRHNLAEKILLGGGSIGASVGVESAPLSMTFLLDRFLPELRETGVVSQKDIDMMLIKNPKRILSFS
jgi:predicted metal-dependent phosphotriesterase family hydrolase